MATVLAVKRTLEAPRLQARTAGVFYLITFVAGGAALSVDGGLSITVNVIATASYVAVTLLFYEIFKPVNRRLNLLAAFFSLLGCAISALTLFHLVPTQVNPLVFFGFYCILIGYLIYRSTFLPRILGVLMAIGGLGWMTFVSARLAHYLFPYNMAPGMLGEGALTLWMLVMGVNARHWADQSGAAGNA